MPKRIARCELCQQQLLLGVKHVCPAQAGKFDWKWTVGFVFQFVVLLATILWKGGAIQADLLNLQKQVDHQQALIDQMSAYFRSNYK